MFIKKSMKVLLLVVLVLALSGFTYAFAAANTVPLSYAGDGAGAVSGYEVSDIHYVLGTSAPTTITGVEFTLDFAAESVSIRLGAVGGSTTWANSCDISGLNVSCTFSTPINVVDALQLQVVAAN